MRIPTRIVALVIVVAVMVVIIGCAPRTRADSASIFQKNLKLRDVHPDVERLQKFLNASGFVVAASGPGSPGHETKTFGAKTLAAVKKFQKVHGLPTTGFFGPMTRNSVAVFVRASTPTNSLTPGPSVTPQTTAPKSDVVASPSRRGGSSSRRTSSDTSAPTAPSELIARAASASSVTLTWGASTDNVGVTSYTILRDGSTVGSTGSTSYTDTGLTASTTHAYIVRAQDAASNTADSRTVYSMAGAWPDGYDAYPVATTQYPSLLDEYAGRSPWRVAGVEYPVGVPSNVVLANPSTISMSGVSLDAGSKIVFVTGNNVTLSGYDFSLSGGWQVYVTGNNVTITQNYFKVEANANPPIVLNGQTATVTYNTIDGADTAVVYTGLINMYGTGLHTVEYNWLKNAYADFFNAGSASQTQRIRYNLFENAGAGNSLGGHPDWLQNYGSSNVFPSIDVSYNTFIQNRTDQATQGFNLSANQGPVYTRFDSVEFSNNTFVLSVAATASTNVNYIFITDPSETTDTITITDNYIDQTGINYSWISIDSKGYGPYGATTTLSGNINMLTGGSLSGQGTFLAVRTTLTTPSEGDTVSGSVTLGATADSTAGISQVLFKRGNAAINSADTTSPYSTSWDTTGLTDGVYTVSAVAKDASGFYATSSVSVTVANNPPEISALSSGSPTTTGTTFTWTTNTRATSKVAWGPTSSYGFSTSSATLSTSHSMLVTGLDANTTYHYAVVSTDALGQTSTSSDATFTTLPQSGYSGPGDIVSGASAWWGLRAYNRAGVGSNVAVVTCASVDYTIPTVLYGGIATTTIASSCGGNTIYLKTLYDQTGNGYDLTQTEQSNQATVTLNCIGALPCITSTGSTKYVVSGLSVSSPQTFTFAGKANAYTAQANILSDTNSQSIVYQTAANTFTTYDGATATHTVTDNTWHAHQIVLGNHSANSYTLDGVSADFTGGSNRPTIGGGSVAFLSYTSNGYGFRGLAAEGGLWAQAFSGSATSSMDSNIRTYWSW